MQIGRKIGYAVGDMGISISYFAVGFFFMYYLTDILGLSPFMAGLAFFIGKLWDGVNDPLMGIISDRTKTRWGRKRVYILFGAVPFAISFILLWMIPASAGQSAKFIMATASLLFYSTAYTVVVVPYMAMVPVMTGDYDERTQITGMRAVFSTIGTIFGGASALLISSFTDEVLGLRLVGTAFGLFSLATLLIAALSIKGLEVGGGDDADLKYSWKAYLSIVKERNVAILLSLKFLGAIATGTLSAALPYFAEHILGNKGSSTTGVAIYVGISALMIPVWNRLTKIYDKRRLLLIGNAVVAAVLFTTALFMGIGSSIPFYIACAFMGIAMSAYLLIPYSLVPDLVEYYQHKTGERHESIFFGLWITVHQLGISVAGLVLGGFLSIFGYDGTLGNQPQEALWGIRLAFGIIPGLFLILAALALQKYGITREVYSRVRAELEQKAL